MTRKNYLAAAEIVRGMARSAHLQASVATGAEAVRLASEATAERDGALEAFITFFSQDNPAFDRARFREACEYQAPAVAVGAGESHAQTVARGARKGTARFVGVKKGPHGPRAGG